MKSRTFHIQSGVGIRIEGPEAHSPKGAAKHRHCNNLLLRDSPFYIVSCFKRFGFKSFFVYTWKLLRGSFRPVCT